ncbi:MAG: nucleotidyltransferase domain-containing protein [Actinomycetota bacterium]|nr:nucleotidyltransferase domain-containing protein [Actinomycetota bacterium]
MTTILWRRSKEARARLAAELDRLEALLRQLRGVEQVWVFGSLVDGRPGPTSDLDLLVIRRTDEPPHVRGVNLARELAPRVAVDLFVYTPEEATAGGRFVDDVRRRGRRLL